MAGVAQHGPSSPAPGGGGTAEALKRARVHSYTGVGDGDPPTSSEGPATARFTTAGRAGLR